MYEAALDNASIFLLAFLYSSEIWSSKDSFWLNLTPYSFSLLLLVMSKFRTFILAVLFVLTNKWPLPALIHIKLSLNYLNKISEASCKDLISPSILSAITYGVLSSA